MILATKAIPSTTIDDFARSLEPRARRAFLQAVERLKGDIDMRALAAALAAGSYVAVQEAIGVQRLADELAPFRDLILDAVRGGGERAAAELALGIRFDITDERALRYVQQHSGLLIREITEETRRGVVELIDLGFRQGFAPPTTARQIRQRIGLTAYQQRIVANYEATLRAAVRGDATWAEVNRYRLNPIRGPGGLIEARVDAAVERYRARLLAHRGNVIAQNETISAANEGQRELWRQLVDRGALPATQLREWLVSPDEKVCPICRPMKGAIATVDGQYSNGLEPGSAHVGCRCGERLIFEDTGA